MKSHNRKTRRSNKSRKSKKTRKMRQQKGGGMKLNRECPKCRNNSWNPACMYEFGWWCAKCDWLDRFPEQENAYLWSRACPAAAERNPEFRRVAGLRN